MTKKREKKTGEETKKTKGPLPAVMTKIGPSVAKSFDSLASGLAFGLWIEGSSAHWYSTTGGDIWNTIHERVAEAMATKMTRDIHVDVHVRRFGPGGEPQ